MSRNAAPGDEVGSETRCERATASAGDPAGDGGAHCYCRNSRRKAVGLDTFLTWCGTLRQQSAFMVKGAVVCVVVVGLN